MPDSNAWGLVNTAARRHFYFENFHLNSGDSIADGGDAVVLPMWLM
jgi:hypothetical protein